MSTFNEPGRPLEFLASEANGQLSRERVTLAANQGNLPAGTVLGRLTSGGNYAVYSNGADTGIEVAVAILAYPANDSASTQTVTVIERLAEVKASLLNWGANDGAGITAGTADLLARNIKVRA